MNPNRVPANSAGTVPGMKMVDRNLGFEQEHLFKRRIGVCVSETKLQTVLVFNLSHHIVFLVDSV